MLLYHDDAQSGTILAPSSAKKATLVYLNFQEIDKRAVLHPFSWLPIGVLSNSECQKTAVGLSGYTRVLLKKSLIANMSSACCALISLFRCAWAISCFGLRSSEGNLFVPRISWTQSMHALL